MNFFNLINDEIVQTLRRPIRVLRIFESGRIGKYLRFQKSRLISKEEWESSVGSLGRRKINSYQDYLTLQSSKLEHLDLNGHENRFKAILAERLKELDWLQPGMRVLCLGARLGSEVAAFRDVGCFAVGIDLNPGKDNPWVLSGDFHNLEFPDSCVDIFYSNSLDHSFALDKVFKEISRVLVVGGHVIVEADPGSAEGDESVSPDLWATLNWQTVEDLSRSIENLGFAEKSKRRFEYPRNGTQLVFVPESQD